MTVYVDDMYRYPMGRYGRMRMSHMIADTEAELHAMAQRIGVARRWYQGDHYDVSMGMREKAISFGARPITLKQLAAMAYFRRCGLPMPPAETAVEEMLLHKGTRCAATHV